jgi:CspA family cold shock protein
MKYFLLKINFLGKSLYLCPGKLPYHHLLLQMNTGIVKFFNESKGFGFIIDDASKEEFFVHATGLVDNVREGDAVTFKVERGKKGMNAVEVKLA